MVSSFNNLILFNEFFHFGFEKFFEEEVGEKYVDALLFLLQFFTHGPHHHVLYFPFSLFSLADIILLPAQGLIEGVNLAASLHLFPHNCFLHTLQHISAPIADFGLIELFLLEGAKVDIVLLEGIVLVEIPLPEYENVVLESLFKLEVDVQIVDSRLNKLIHFTLLQLFCLQILSGFIVTFRAEEMCCLR
jgi:hypothetical protein